MLNVLLLFHQLKIQDKEEKKSKHVKETVEKDMKLADLVEGSVGQQDLSSAIDGKKVIDVDAVSLGDFSDDSKKLKQSDISISSRSSIDSNMNKQVTTINLKFSSFKLNLYLFLIYVIYKCVHNLD